MDSVWEAVGTEVSEQAQLRLSSGTTASGGPGISGDLDIFGWVDLCRGNGSVGKGSWCKSDGDFDYATTFWGVQPRGPSYLPTRSLLPGEGATQQMRPQKPKQQLEVT